MSKGWWVNMFTALKFHKYTAKDWAIWNLSSYATYGMVFGVFKPIATFIAAKLPWFFPLVTKVWTTVATSVVAGVSAAWHFVVNGS